jgi:carbon storage regulator
MLVLSRKTLERVRIGEDIMITIVRIGPNVVRVGIDAPKEMAIVREEILRPIDASKIPNYLPIGAAP